MTLSVCLSFTNAFLLFRGFSPKLEFLADFLGRVNEPKSHGARSARARNLAKTNYLICQYDRASIIRHVIFITFIVRVFWGNDLIDLANMINKKSVSMKSDAGGPPTLKHCAKHSRAKRPRGGNATPSLLSPPWPGSVRLCNAMETELPDSPSLPHPAG